MCKGDMKKLLVSSLVVLVCSIVFLWRYDPPAPSIVVTWSPSPTRKLKLWRVSNFFSAAECEYIKEQCRPLLKRCDTPRGWDRKCEEVKGEVYYPNYPVFSDLVARMESLLHDEMAPHDSMSVQIVRYGVGGKFQEHFDEPFIATTMMVYLSDVEEASGGHTEFPKLGIKLQPKQGELAMWHNFHPNGEINSDSMHRGNPIFLGEKWILNFFITYKNVTVFRDHCRRHYGVRMPINNTAPFKYVSARTMAHSHIKKVNFENHADMFFEYRSLRMLRPHSQRL